MKVFLKNFINTLAQTTTLLTGYYISFISRPVKSEHINNQPRSVTSHKPFAIIIQGPINKTNSFTLETVRHYKKSLLNSTHIIVSTWDDEDPEILTALRTAGAHIISNKKPATSGIFNINYQITSVKNALDLASELGAEYVLKTRTDTRIYAPNIEEYLCGLLTAFPANKAFDQKYRIVGLSLNSYLYRMYNISDIVMFGHIYDMEKYWSITLDSRTHAPSMKTNTLREWSEYRMVETYLTAHYLEHVGRKLLWSVEDAFKAFADHFIIIDEQSLDLLWYKYSYWKEYRRKDYRQDKNDVFITFRDWISFYSNVDSLSHLPEHAVELPFEANIKQ